MDSYKTADPFKYTILKEFARENRKNPTQAEEQLWNYLRNGQLGTVFKRQHVIDNYIADFISIRQKLIIEVDGGYHNLSNQINSDEERTEMLNHWGYRIIRFTNEEVLFNIDMVIEKIKRQITYPKPISSTK
ncbi:MAG: endonuclease domain-containing protein [Bacteroidaceae bacterium]|nr:endonuclease domain-containing protein [Bacteroidaceae bacterium]